MEYKDFKKIKPSKKYYTVFFDENYFPLGLGIYKGIKTHFGTSTEEIKAVQKDCGCSGIDEHEVFYFIEFIEIQPERLNEKTPKGDAIV